MATRTQTRIIHYLLKTPVREVRVQVSAQHVKGESEGTKSGGGPDPETKLYKALEDNFLPKLTNLTCYFLDFKSLADKLKKGDNTVLKTRKDKSFRHTGTGQCCTEFRRYGAVLTATSESVLP